MCKKYVMNLRTLHMKSFLFTCIFLFVSKVSGTCTYTQNTQYTCGDPQNTGTVLSGTDGE